MPRFFLVIIGIMAIMFAIFRHMAKRRDFGESYTRYINEHRLPPLDESNDLGQKVKWIIEPDEQNEERNTGGTEHPAGESR